nr:hypothetical protein [Tanacetum cinerariifolium]
MQTQTSNALHNAIMEAGSKDRPLMLALGNYVQWKSRIKRYIDTKPNHELIYYCLQNSPYKYQWVDKEVLVTEDLETNLYWEFGKFTSRDGESLESYYLRFYKMMNELVRNQCDVTSHQVNVQFLLQLQPEWQRFVTLVKQSQELKTVSYHKLYDILKQHQNEVNEIRAERLVRTANPLALVAQQPVYHPQNHPAHYTQNSSTRSQQAATRNRRKAIVNSPAPIYDQESSMVAEDDEMSKDKEINKLMALIYLSFKKIYKPTNNNLQTSSNTSRANQDNSLRFSRGTGYNNQRIGNVARAKENVEAHYMYMERLQKVTPDATNNSGPIFYTEPVQQTDQNDDADDLDNERELLASLIEILKCEIDDRKNRNKFLETSNKALIDKLKDKEIDKVIDLENKVKVLDNIVYKTGQSVQTMNMLNRNCKMSFAKPGFLKKAQRANPRLYDIGCYNDNLALMLAPESDEVIRLEKERIIPTTSVSRPQLKCNQLEDRVMRNNSQGKNQEVEEHRRNVKFSKNKTTKMPMAVHVSTREPKCIVNQSVTKPLRRTVALESTNQKPRSKIRKLYEHTILFIIDSGCSKHMTRNLNLLINFVEKFLGLNHNLFSVGQLCDADFEVAFRKSTCYIRDLKGNDLLTGSHGTDLYSITLQDTYSPNPICLMAKASSSQAWLWHRRLSYLNFDTINLLSKNDIVIGVLKLKFIKDHLCSSCELGKAKRKSFQTKTTPSSKIRLQLLHMDLCGPIRVESINGKKYVLVIIDDYSRYTWTHFLRSKDETPEVLIDFLRLVQRGLHAKVRTVRTDKGTEFLNKTLHAYFATEGIDHQTSVARTPEQNSVVERRNRTLVEAARTMLSAAKVPLFFWAEAIATYNTPCFRVIEVVNKFAIYLLYFTRSL